MKFCGMVLSGAVNVYELALGLVTVDNIYNELEADSSAVTVDTIYGDVAGQHPVFAKSICSV